MISFCAWCSLFPPLLSASMKTLKQMIHLQVGHHDLKTDDALKQGTSIYVACQCDCQHHMPVKCSQKFRVPGRVVYASSAACAAAAATVSKFRVSRVGCCYTLAHESVAFRVVVGLSGRFRMGWGRASGPGPGILPTWSEGPNLVRRSGLGVASYTWTCRVGASESQIPGKKVRYVDWANWAIFNSTLWNFQHDVRILWSYLLRFENRILKTAHRSSKCAPSERGFNWNFNWAK